MNPTTNVHDLPTRRRDDTGDTHRSTPAYAVLVQPPCEYDEPFADALIAQARQRRLHAANVVLAKRTEERLADEQLRKNQLNEAHRAGHNLGLDLGFTRGWYWGLGFGVVIGGSVVALALKASALVVGLT